MEAEARRPLRCPMDVGLRQEQTLSRGDQNRRWPHPLALKHRRVVPESEFQQDRSVPLYALEQSEPPRPSPERTEHIQQPGSQVPLRRALAPFLPERLPAEPMSFPQLREVSGQFSLQSDRKSVLSLGPVAQESFRTPAREGRRFAGHRQTFPAPAAPRVAFPRRA